MLRLRQIFACAEPSPQLQLHFSQPLDLATDAPLLRQWLQQYAPISRLQTEISMDLVLIRFSFAEQTFYQGLTTHKNKYDFVTINPVEKKFSDQLQKPPGMDFWQWIDTANITI